MSNYFANEAIKFSIKSDAEDCVFNTIILEPLNIIDSLFCFERDSDYYGFHSEFMEDTIRLQFSEEPSSGKNDIDKAFNLYGGDAVVMFLVEIYTDNKWVEFFKAKFNFNTYKTKDSLTECSIERMSFDSLFRTRFDTSISVLEPKTIDGLDDAPLLPNKITMQSQGVTKSFISTPPLDLPDKYFWVNDDNFPSRFIVGVPNTVITLDETEEQTEIESAIFLVNKTTPLQFMNQIATSLYFQYKSRLSGNTTFYFDKSTVTYEGRTNRHWLDSRPNSNWILESWLIIYDAAKVIKFQKRFDYKDVKNVTSCHIVCTPKMDGVTAWMDAGDMACIFHVGFQDGIKAEDRCNMRILQANTVKVVQVEEFVSTNVSTWILKDVLRKNLRSICNTDSLTSSMLDGIAKKIAITNGWNLRGVLDKTLNTSMKDTFAFMSACWNMGYSIVRMDNGIEKMIIEQMDYFFKDKKIITFEEVYDLEVNFEKDITFNEIEIGYEKYSEEDVSGRFAFNTYRQYLLPIKTYKKQRKVKSPYIADGILISQVRSYSLEINKDETKSEDDYTFVATLNTAMNSSVDDSIVSVDGIPNGERCLNFAISPARMVSNWMNYINSILSFKKETEVIDNRLSIGANVVGSITGQSVITENQSFNVDNSKKIFKPVSYTFKSSANWLQYILIRDSYLGDDTKENFNGYIEIIVDSKQIAIFATLIKYNPITSIIEITGWEKY